MGMRETTAAATAKTAVRCSSPGCDLDKKPEQIKKIGTADGRFRWLCLTCIERRRKRRG